MGDKPRTDAGKEETIELLNSYYALMFDVISGHCGAVNPMIGDAPMTVVGAPAPLADLPFAAIRAVLDMQEMIKRFNVERVALEKSAAGACSTR